MEEKMRSLIENLEDKKLNSVTEQEWDAYEFAIGELQNILTLDLLAQIDRSKKCKDCGEHFEITEREAEFYKKNNLFLPKRCPACREARKFSKKEVI